ncbi:hypothetical protein N2152v2_011240 [Parachlorella kessleri]
MTLKEDHHENHEDSHGGKGGYVFSSPEEVAAVKAQRALLWDFLKDVGSHLLRDGLNLTKISMPVQLFEPRSWLERMCDNWSYLDLLECAADQTDPVERLKYLVAFVVGGLRQQVSFGKPFNPILGETYQAQYSGGIEVFVEQISHHPPISSWQVDDRDGRFSFWGNGSWSASARGNSVKGHQSGTNSVRFSSDGAVVTWQLPYLTIKGVLFGERSLKYSGHMVFEDRQNGLTCELEIDPGSGASFFTSLFRRRKQVQHDQVVGSIKNSDGEVLDTLHGSWLTHLEWEKGVLGGKLRTVWDYERCLVRRPTPAEAVLPSDSRHREDLSHLKVGDTKQAQHWKLELEQLQRKDKKLRAEEGIRG